MRPPILYFGAKGNIAEAIVDLMPEHSGYVEPFAGSLAVLLAKDPVRLEVVNDLDRHLITFWRVLRDRPLDLARMAELTPHSRLELDQAADFITAAAADVDDLAIAHSVWILLTQGRSRTLKRTGWRFFFEGDRSSMGQQYLAAYRDRLLPAAERIRDVSLECRDALEVIDDYGKGLGNLLYVDPPYAATTRRAGRYSHEFATEDEHRELAEHLQACTAAVMLSGYPSDLYDSLYSEWWRYDLRAQSNNATVVDRVEVVWANRDLAGGRLW